MQRADTCQSRELPGPAPQSVMGNIRLAPMIQHRSEPGMLAQSARESLEVRKVHQCIKRQVTLDNRVEGRIKRGFVQPRGVADILYHWAESLELSATLG